MILAEGLHRVNETINTDTPPLRLLAGADRLPLSLWGSRGGGGGREAHRGQAGAGAAIVAGPGGKSQSVTDGSQLTSPLQ